MAAEPAPRPSGSTRRSGTLGRLGRDKVMDVALQMFLHRGYAGTSLKTLASELGVSASALYWYFPSKEDLYVAVIEQEMCNFVSYVRDSITAVDPLGRLGQLVRAHVTWQLQQSEVARAFDRTMSVASLTQEIPAARLERIKAMEIAYVRELREVLAEGHERGLMRVGEVTSTAFAIITLCEYVHTWYRPNGRLSIAAVANSYEGMVRNLVGAASPGLV